MFTLTALVLAVLPQGSSPELAGLVGVPGGIPISRQARGLDRVDGELWAVGATYKARFDRGGPMIVPPLGADAPRSLPLWLSFESAEIGGARFVVADDSAEPERGELEVRYRHGAALTERYEVRTDGLEQSFVFHELPAERGELVVRLHTTTELVPRTDGAGLFFEGSSGRGLRYGALTAVDARGRRAAGEVRLVGDALELVAPADFVATAELPLVLDPLIGGPIDVYFISDLAGDPDVDSGFAGGSSDAIYLVVFEFRFSATDIDVYGVRIDADTGAVLGPQVFFETSISKVSMNPSVAEIHDPGWSDFFVVWQEGSSASGPFDIRGRAVPYSQDTVSLPFQTVTISGASGSDTDPCITGLAISTHATSCPQYKRFLVAWVRGGIRARAVDLDTCSGTTAILGPEFPISTDPNDSLPAIAHAGQVAGMDEALLVWERFFSSPAPGDRDLQRAVVRNVWPDSFTLVVNVPDAALISTIGPDERRPDLTRLLGGEMGVAFDRGPSSTSSDQDVHFARVALNQTVLATSVSLGPTLPIAVGSGDDDGAAVTLHFDYLSNEQVTVAWVGHGTAGFGSVRGFGLQNAQEFGPLAALAPCELEHEVAGSAVGLGFQDVEMASAGADLPMLAVFESVGLGVWGQGLGPLFDVGPSETTFVHGGCGSGGLATRTCPCATNANFTHALKSAAPGRPVFLVMSADLASIGCGACVLAPDPFTGFVVAAGTTSATGTAVVPMPISDQPALVGLRFYDQWAVLVASPACEALGVDLSTAVRFEIQAP